MSTTDILLEEEKEPSFSNKSSLIPYDPLYHYLAEIRRYPFLSREEEFELAKAYKERGNKEAATKLILSNLRFVVSVAMEYKNIQMNLMDIIQEGNIGLLHAVKGFEPSKNIRLTTYAKWWIKAYIIRYILRNWRLVKIGTTEAQRKLFFNLKKEKERLEKLGCADIPKLLSHKLNVREEEVIEMDQRLGNWEVSIDAPVSTDSNKTIIEDIPSQDTGIEEDIEQIERKSFFSQKLKEFSRILNDRDLEVLNKRILSESPMTLEDIGKRYGISRERVRQIEKMIIKRLKKFVNN
ncbi:MAG: RNA polymerase factor sigma-32 [Nitrospirota bacterium]